MAVLRKIRSATLVEALTATVLIVIIFLVASLIINNLLLNTYSTKTQGIDNRIGELEYQIINIKITLPYSEEADGWKVEAKKVNHENATWVVLTATSNKTGKQTERAFFYGDN